MPAYVFYPVSMGKRIGTLGNAKPLPSSPGLPATKLRGSYSHLPFALLFLQWPSFSTVSGGEKHHPIGLATWRIHCDTRAGHWTGPAPHVYLLVKDLASRRVHRSTSSSVCGEGSCCVRVQLCANSVCFKQTHLSDRAFLTTMVE